MGLQKNLAAQPLATRAQTSRTSIATAAVLTMGEGIERQPLALVTKAPARFTDTKQRDVRHNIKDDLYLPLLKKLPKE